MTPELIHSSEGHEIWHGDCLDAEHVRAIMDDRKANMLCVDAPYSEKTHAGHDGGVRQVNGFTPKPGTPGYQKTYADKGRTRNDIDYPSWDEDDVSQCVLNFESFINGWWCSITDDVLAPRWARFFEHWSGLYTFAPLPWVEVGSRVRLCGDGPSNWSCWLVVGRPKKAPFSKWGTLRGAYILPAENHQNRPERITGGKSLIGMCQLIEDYSRPGDLIVDPCLGGGSTMIAARMTGRRCIGIDIDRGRAELCAELMKHGARSKLSDLAKQETLFT
jgi:hypothetical protein